jgi:hypothetical protein
MEVLLAGVVLSLVGAALFATLLGAERSARRAGQYAAAAALAQSVIEEMRLYGAADPRLEPGRWDWCPPECPDRIDRVLVEVAVQSDLSESLRRVAVSVYRTGLAEPVQVVSYVRR